MTRFDALMDDPEELAVFGRPLVTRPFVTPDTVDLRAAVGDRPLYLFASMLMSERLAISGELKTFGWDRLDRPDSGRPSLWLESVVAVSEGEEELLRSDSGDILGRPSAERGRGPGRGGKLMTMGGGVRTSGVTGQ